MTLQVGQHGRAVARLLLLAMLSSATFALAGCGDGGPTGVDLWGNITWRGKPVPAGYVVFDPDVKQGNSGHQGMAEIKNGCYDTRMAGGRRVANGRQVVSIAGFDSPPIASQQPRGARLFLPHEQAVEPPTHSGELDLVVPESVMPIKSVPTNEE